MGVARLGDRAATVLGATRMLRWNHAGVAHHLSGLLETAEAAELSGQCDGRNLGNTAHRLQRVDDRAELVRRFGDRPIDGTVEAFDALSLMIDFENVVDQRCVLFRVRKSKRSCPLPPCRSPGPAAVGWSL